MAFDLQNYETVKSRKKRFYADHKDGSIIVELIFRDDTHAVMKASVYKTKEEQQRGLPTATGYASETKGIGSPANRIAFLENAEESAVGRALDNAGYSGNDKCSREEMAKVVNVPEVVEGKIYKHPPSPQDEEPPMPTDNDLFGDEQAPPLSPRYAAHKTASPSLTSGQASDLHDYKIKIGKKYIGRTLGSILPKTLSEYANYLMNSSKEQGRPLGGVGLETYNAIIKHLDDLKK